VEPRGIEPLDLMTASAVTSTVSFALLENRSAIQLPAFQPLADATTNKVTTEELDCGRC